MPRRTLYPAALAAIGGLLGHVAWHDPLLIVLSAATGAAAGALLTPQEAIVRTQTVVPEPEPERETGPAIEDVLELMPLGVLIVAENQQVVYANKMVAELFGLTRDGDVPVANLRSRRLLDRIATAFRQGTGSTLEFTLSRSSGAALLATIRPLTVDGKTSVVVAIQDETRARRASELHRDFVANASHELKTPLAAVSGIIETLLGPARDDPKASERFLGILLEQTTRMTRLIEDLLSLNRIELNARVVPDEPQDVFALLSEVMNALQAIAEAADVSLDYDQPKAQIIALADRDEVCQLFRNLIDNAIKYGGSGTTVSINTMIDPPEAPGMVGISVRDRGPGIAREDIPRLTERFYRVNVKHSRDKGGTGLGLAICKHIISRHRGRLEIESKLGEGSRFTVWLPIHASEEAVIPETKDAAETSARSGAK